MSPPRNISSAHPRLSRQGSLTNEAPVIAPVRRPLLRRQRSVDDDRPITQLLQSALTVTASALGPGFIAVQPPPPPPKPHKAGPLRPVRVAWAELRAVGREPPPSPKQPTCLPALARANLDIFLAHSGLAHCLANIDLGRQSPKPPESVKASPRDIPIKAALTPIPRTPTLASSRRVNFKNTSRTVINRSFNDSPEPQKLAPPSEKGLRILSAPAHRSAPIITPPRPMLRSLPRRSPFNSSFESETSTDTRVKSAPSKKRLKTAGRTSKRSSGAKKGDESSDEEDSVDPPLAAPTPPKPNFLTANVVPKTSRRGLRIGAEIVTMVSLISPTHSSDSESEATPGVHQVVPVPNVEATPAWQDKEADDTKEKSPPLTIVCARKINKSVSFQSRSSLPELLRRASIQLAKSESEEEVVATEEKDVVEKDENTSTRAIILEAKDVEKSPPAAVAVSTTTGIMKAPAARRKLIRTKAVVRQNSKLEPDIKLQKDSSDSQSESSFDSVIKKEPDKSIMANTSPPVPISILKPPTAPLASAEEMDLVSLDGSPKFESPKEKECWHLYRKMCEKGLTVSFDTVLRGMLTPTEYRLRRGALLSTC